MAGSILDGGSRAGEPASGSAQASRGQAAPAGTVQMVCRPSATKRPVAFDTTSHRAPVISRTRSKKAFFRGLLIPQFTGTL